jgi:cellulose biosynthesis protein BcsQ
VNSYKSNAILHESGIKQMDKLVEHFGIRRLQTKMHSRVVYGEANSQGYGVVELDNIKAKKEIVGITKEILAIIK